ncbi:acetolactate decarboxylase [Marinoscillum furvescens]|uniref:Alpha-acetolactate decarboxylase n=1 Tax=Marinoscillum furvescens DSM 4134 TaxID=1122208 RepID=A0A3D9L006_MARFU|nr:acetolactate decarboxylase [Marinoscillum furvescens]RED96004.1 acetolactate decarboxylase [Marinoscillum furvescens DSM 4134]
MKKLAFMICLSAMLAACQKPCSNQEITSNTAVTKDKFYHYSIWYAFVNRIFDGELTAERLYQNGDLGLGSFDRLDGELIMLDGKLYRATEDGKVTIAQPKDKIAYVNATFFEADHTFEVQASNYDELRAAINARLPSRNIFYAFKISGEFDYMKCGGLHKQDKPFDTGLDVLIPNRPIFERSNFSGTMVGFFSPDFIGDINVAGYHLHFVSDDEQFAGHVMDFKASSLQVHVDELYAYEFELPRQKEYLEGDFDKRFQYEKK